MLRGCRVQRNGRTIKLNARIAGFEKGRELGQNEIADDNASPVSLNEKVVAAREALEPVIEPLGKRLDIGGVNRPGFAGGCFVCVRRRVRRAPPGLRSRRLRLRPAGGEDGQFVYWMPSKAWPVPL
jgi:hypothetical protein